MINRRHFFKSSALAALPMALPLLPNLAGAMPAANVPPMGKTVKFFGDGEMFEPGDYIQLLQEIHAANPITKDRYGSGGAVEALEKKFATITGKQKAVYMASGTMANQLAIAALSGEKSKVFVQDTSHVFRDEADAAQSIFNKRLVPLAPGQAYFTAAQLQEAIESLPEQEVFSTGIGAVSIENPVRRSQGQMMPIGEIEKVSIYCKSKGIKLHLDGARIYLASAWSGVPIAKYAAHFDTVYISLYKYLGASAGAILCGDKALIDGMQHLMKVHGGSMYGNWTNAAMALHRLDGVEQRMKEAKLRGEEVFVGLNKIDGIKVHLLKEGTNIYVLELSKNIDGKKLQASLNTKHNIRIGMPDKTNKVHLSVNETLLYHPASTVINSFKQSI